VTRRVESRKIEQDRKVGVPTGGGGGGISDLHPLSSYCVIEDTGKVEQEEEVNPHRKGAVPGNGGGT